ncbi:transcription initiation factor IIA, gamma subunit [Coccomyxa subellipsoidea C-169]|uniref:Transcription initiation factor IIA subunit 2 n=1 Tax=Coccomyxa subellipsoidea (strain C-169) TaxID=574566 RepID=I0YZC5_COCSC|nr:transcription initiation factor IIA, gamma subunit [Coccomyxa subellipsoidea C-169]EIE23744.1 transcription initiation factor IIA, gamma subunit [Coccomyxa subellipsoidea C-169]|eukprot:XP_005648288.1 transcription initiation factor IIA, gamma subunit [Coccomyxa subellipsoidea C-169]
MTMLTLYRTSKIGDCLAEALDEMITQDKIPGDLGMKVMAEFDSAIYKALEKDVTTKTLFKGHLDSYRYCDQVWTMVMSDTNFRMETTGPGGSSRSSEVKADKIKLVCVDERLWQQQPQQ